MTLFTICILFFTHAVPAHGHGIGSSAAEIPEQWAVTAALCALGLSFIIATKYASYPRTYFTYTVPLSTKKIARHLVALTLSLTAGLALYSNHAPEHIWYGFMLLGALLTCICGDWMRSIQTYTPTVTYSWFAVACLFGLFWIELISGLSTHAVYMSPLLVGLTLSLLFSLYVPSSHHNPLRLYYDSLGAVACAQPPQTQHTSQTYVIALCIIASATMFDSLMNTPLWESVRNHIGLPHMSTDSLGLLFSAWALYSVYYIALVLAEDMPDRPHPYDVRESALRYAPALSPLASGYILSHYTPELMQALTTYTHVLTKEYVWFAQISIIICAHCISTLVMHRIAETHVSSPTHRTRHQFILLVFTFFVTSVSLYCMST